MELWQMVVADHANIEELCREVLRATGSRPNSRAELFADLRDELERHFAAQQNVLYPALSSHERTAAYLADLESKQEEILRELDRLAARPDKNSADWATDFKELTGSIRHAFTLEENGVMIVARGAFSPDELKTLWRRYERERIASYEAERWHMPQSMMPSRYGLPTGTVFGVLAGLAAVGAGALLWNMTRSGRPGSRQGRPLHAAPRRPQPPFPLDRGVIDHSLEGSRRGRMGEASSGARTYRAAGPASAAGTGAEASSSSTAKAATADDALLHGAGGGAAPAAGGSPSDDTWFSSAHPPRAPSGLSTPLQPGGTLPAGSPAGSTGSLGTGGAQTGGAGSGSPKRDGQ
ncbi:hemerythrin domain-containing protein [Microvirga lotononidis]|uniref:Hemerythrin HHE cation binding domain-containing protein n=1 Tax=Microvirga lotononidis TaxID=864069 RepID=I4YV64_9HYPH|nr:hemerythrin domain-containing protein [Microvirga lotononidis]EIM27856.1 hemerythrin HHE cation binding domain-containing protein [Microvirga lotononidis]WQO28014.1 hemerythrin domain-containing protein [Microvirga lotononidis]